MSGIVFKKSTRYSALVKKFAGTKMKVKGSTAMQQMCIATIDIPISKAILSSLEPKYQKWVETEEAANSDRAKSKHVQHQMEFFCIFKVFKRSTYNTRAEPELCKGAAGDNARLVLEKIHFIDEEPYLRGKLYFKKDQATWDWGGRMFDDNEIMIESKPHQPDLPMNSEGGDGEDADGDGDGDGKQGTLLPPEDNGKKKGKKGGKKSAANDDEEDDDEGEDN